MSIYENQRIFNETIKHIEGNDNYKVMVEKSIFQTSFYEDISDFQYDEDEKYRENYFYGNTGFVEKQGTVEAVFNSKSFTVARMTMEKGKKTAVLNMANPFSPGGDNMK